MTEDTRTYIKLHDGMPDHPKIVGLTDAGFRMLVECWCYCSRHLTDGKVTDAALRKLGPAKARTELIASGMLAALPDGKWDAHDYLQHQRSAAEVSELRTKRRAAGRASAKARAEQNGSKHLTSVEQGVEQNGNTAATETETETEITTSGRRKRATAPPERFEITDDLRDWAAENAPDVRLVVESAKLVDWARGKGERKADWIASWRNWMRRAQQNILDERARRPAQSADYNPDREEIWMRG